MPIRKRRKLWWRRIKNTDTAKIESERQRVSLEEIAEQQAHEQKLHDNIEKLRDLVAYDVMIPRADIAAIEIEDDPAAIFELIRQKSHSRYPVYRQTMDDILGYVQIKNLLDVYAQHQTVPLEKLIEKPLFIVPSMRILDLLLQMRYSKIYLALVIDEYGGIDGLISIEDLMEAILGTVDSSTPEDRAKIIEQANGALIVEARTSLEDFERKIGYTLEIEDLDRDEVDTVGGMIFFHTGRVPSRGEVIAMTPLLEFEILDADPRRIKWVRIMPKKQAA